MEKIYMENNNKKNKNSGLWKILNSKGSVMWSFAIAIIAIVGLVVVGINQISYAAPQPIEQDLGESFVTAAPSVQIYGQGGAQAFPVFMYKTSTGVPIFCLERNINYQQGTTMNRGDEIFDQTLLYIMANSYPHKTFSDSNGVEFPAEVQTWITQATIWQYLYESNYDNNDNTSGTGPANVENIQKVNYIYWSDGSDSVGYSVDGAATTGTATTFYAKYIKPLIDDARSSSAMIANFTLSKENDDISITNDEKYYQSSLFTIADSDPGNRVDPFTIELKAPKDTIIVDKNGNVIEDLNNVTVDGFYVRVPVANVTEDSKTVEVSVGTKYRGYRGYYYTAPGAQTVSTVFTSDVYVMHGMDVLLNYTPKVPDTGVSTAQTIYFIGLIVLLSGIGIIYANAKPSQSN